MIKHEIGNDATRRFLQNLNLGSASGLPCPLIRPEP